MGLAGRGGVLIPSSRQVATQTLSSASVSSSLSRNPREFRRAVERALAPEERRREKAAAAVKESERQQ